MRDLKTYAALAAAGVITAVIVALVVRFSGGKL